MYNIVRGLFDLPEVAELCRNWRIRFTLKLHSCCTGAFGSSHSSKACISSGVSSASVQKQTTRADDTSRPSLLVVPFLGALAQMSAMFNNNAQSEVTFPFTYENNAPMVDTESRS
ncbi:unnamed protein product [Ixodes pacificus]